MKFLWTLFFHLIKLKSGNVFIPVFSGNILPGASLFLPQTRQAALGLPFGTTLGISMLDRSLCMHTRFHAPWGEGCRHVPPSRFLLMRGPQRFQDLPEAAHQLFQTWNSLIFSFSPPLLLNQILSPSLWIAFLFYPFISVLYQPLPLYSGPFLVATAQSHSDGPPASGTSCSSPLCPPLWDGSFFMPLSSSKTSLTS